MSRTVFFDGGTCPYPICTRMDRHAHPICSECGTVNYENAACLTCRTMEPVYRNGLITIWRDAQREGAA